MEILKIIIEKKYIKKKRLDGVENDLTKSKKVKMLIN